LTGEHTVHQTVYGRYRQTMRWEGMEEHTGFFDDPKPHPTDDE